MKVTVFFSGTEGTGKTPLNHLFQMVTVHFPTNGHCVIDREPGLRVIN